MEVVADASAVDGLEQGNLLQGVSVTSIRIAVSDHYCRQHQPNRTTEELRSLGLFVETLPPEAVSMAKEHLGHDRGLSQCDAYALALAQASSRSLVTLEPKVRQRAEKACIKCEDIFSIFDALEEESAVGIVILRQALLTLQGGHCRLPEREIKKRLERYEEILQGRIFDNAANRLSADETRVGGSPVEAAHAKPLTDRTPD